MKKLKQLTLILASLLVVAFSFNSLKSFDSAKSFKSKSIECHFAALADDDLDDDITDTRFQVPVEFNQDFLYKSILISGSHYYTSASPTPSISFFLKVRNLRI